jgi:excisionase family DNA binding protein
MARDTKAESPSGSADSAPRAPFPEVMTIDQAAEYLQLHRQVLYRYVRDGAVPAVRVGGAIRLKKSVLDAFLEQGSWEHVREYLAYARQRTRAAPKASAESEPSVPSRRFSEDID